MCVIEPSPVVETRRLVLRSPGAQDIPRLAAAYHGINIKLMKAGGPREAWRMIQLAREHGLTPTQLALAFCYNQWQVASTIIGVTTLAQLDEDMDVYGTVLSPELLKQIDAIRWDIRDPVI